MIMGQNKTWQQVYDDMQTEEKKLKWWQGWFQKGAFADGYDFGDITKTYLGLRADLSQNVFSAVLDATENLMDTGAYMIGAFGNENFKKTMSDFIAKDTFQRDKTAKWIYDHIPYDALGVNVWSKYVIGDDVEQASLLNEKTDSLVQSVAHQVGSRALNLVGVPWQLTTGVNSFGSEIEEGFGKGAGYWEAGISGGISAGVEIGSESLFSGSTVGEKGLFNLDSLTSGIKNKAVKALADIGVDMAAEGVEEVVSNFGSSLGQLIYEADNPQEAWEILQDKNSFDNLMTAFISGAVMSGGGNFTNVASSVVNQTDYRTGLTAEEQSVFDSVYESKVKDYVDEHGKNPKGKAKKQIFTDTLNELNEGAVSTEAIGYVLDPETQKRYSEVSSELSALQQEYDQLYNMKDGEKTDAQRDRQAELKGQIDELKAEQQDLDSRLEELAKGTRMEESYRERARKGQKLQADPNQYSSSSASQTVRNIVESGVMNDTRRSHEFVGMLAKISEDTGLVFSTTDAQRLKNTGFAVDGAVVNGYYTENGVAININTPQALETVVGHEVAHALEGSDFYEPLKNAVISFAKNKGEYKSLMDSLVKLYTGKPGYETDFQAKMEKELVADLVGKYLFTDADFVRSLSVQNRNLFQRLFDEIKYLLRITKPGSKEAKQLEKIKKLFEEVYRDAKNTAPSDGVKYSLEHQEQRITASMTDTERSNILKKKKIVAPVYNGEADASIANEKDLNNGRDKFIKAALLRIGKEFNVFSNYDIKDVDVQITLSKGNLRESITKDANPVQLAKLLPILKETVENAVGVESHTNRYFYDNTTESFDILLGGYIDGDDFVPVRFGLKHIKGGETVLYVVIDQKKIKAEVLKTTTQQDDGSAVSRPAFVYNIPQIVSLVNSKDLLKYLPDDMLSWEQKEIKKEGIAETINYTNDKNDRKYLKFVTEGNIQAVRTMVKEAAKAAGYGKLFYHGSKNGGEHTVFRDWSYFTENKQYAERYAQRENGKSLYSAYVKLEKPFDTRNPEHRKQFDDIRQEYGLSEIQDTGLPDWTDGYDIADYIDENNLDFDGIILDEGGDLVDGKPVSRGLSYVIRKSAQIKSAEPITYDYDGNIIPISQRFDSNNNDIRYSLSANNTNLMGDIAYESDVALAQDDNVQAYDIQNQITDLQGRLQQAVQDGDMEEAAMLGKDLYDLQHPDETLGTNENTNPGAQEDVPDPVKAILGEETDFLSKRADELYQEIGTLKKGSGKRASATLSYLLDHVGKDWTPLKTALLNIKDNPAEVVNPKSAAETMAREILSREYQESAEELQQMQTAAKKPAEIRTAKDRFMAQIYNMGVELATTKANKQQSLDDYNAEIAELEKLYDSKAKKTTKVANDIKARIARTIRRRDNQDASYDRAIARLQESLARKMTDEAKTANQRQFKQEQYYDWAEKLVGDTSTWKDKKIGLQYMTNTLRRNLRDIVKDEKGNPDYAKADAIYEELQGKYNLHEAELNRELTQLHDKYADLKITEAEDVYIQMLGEFRHNPQTTLSLETVENFYKEHKKKIDPKKVDQIIEMARKDYDDLIQRVNEVLREQGMKEIPYRKGYFPHFTLDKQGRLAKLLNWKAKNDDIPTDIAGLTETFEPKRSYQHFDKQRTSDITDYSFTKGFDQYSFGALDWIYHIEDIQKRRALENYIRYVHSDDGVKAKVDAIRNNEEYDADEAQKQIDAVYEEARNPLNNFVIDLRRGTQTLAAKKSPLDRELEYASNRRIYSTMTNISNRVSANMVAGSISAAITNFIPITQSWGGVSPFRSLQAMAQTLRNAIRDDGMIDKSAFLTNRLRKAENLHKTGWDKASDKISWLMNAIDSFTSQTVWRSRYDANRAKGMSEADAIHDADLFAESVLAGRSRGNMPTIFDSKNPFIKTITAFQLEVANQYGYLFKDMRQDAQNQNKAKLAMKYAEVFIGAYVFNSLFKAMTGRTAAFDPIRIIKELMQDIFEAADEEDDEDTKWSDVAINFGENVLQEVPFVGGLIGGGRVPISSALPYGGLFEAFKGTVQDIENFGEGGLKDLTKEWLNPVTYILSPLAGGQLKKTIEGFSMFGVDKPVSGSYTDDGKLRFAVDQTPGNFAQALLFGQWASDEAQQYIDEGRKPLSEKQTQEFAELDIPIQQYWDIRDNLTRIDKSDSKTKQADKVDYINSLDLSTEQKNILVNNILDRKEDVDMTDYDKYGSFAEFDFSVKYPEKYSFLQQNGISYADYERNKDAYSWAYQIPGKYAVSKVFLVDTPQYYSYIKAISQVSGDKDGLGRTISGSLQAKRAKYIGSLPLTKIEKALLMKQYYPSFSAADTAILQFISGTDSLTRDEKIVILFELGLLPDELNLLPLIGGNV